MIVVWVKRIIYKYTSYYVSSYYIYSRVVVLMHHFSDFRHTNLQVAMNRHPLVVELLNVVVQLWALRMPAFLQRVDVREQTLDGLLHLDQVQINLSTDPAKTQTSPK